MSRHPWTWSEVNRSKEPTSFIRLASRALVAAAVVAAASCSGPQLSEGPSPDTTEFDVLLLGGTLVDGTGAAATQTNIGVRDGRLVLLAPGADAIAKKRFASTASWLLRAS